jgi:hypothetical protein
MAVIVRPGVRSWLVSVPVPVEKLQEASEEYGTAAFLLTTGNDGRAKVASVEVRFDGAGLALDVGGGSAANASARPLVTLFWPPPTPGGYSLIVDADATVDGATVRLAPSRGVLHRPATSGVPSGHDGCAADCEPLFPR